ncbi:NB-ARC domain-containing protein [Fusarium sp. LHS14.1]|nr:NB-ARC domain-containing protein [Fusarium sp. LHS14.1]
MTKVRDIGFTCLGTSEGSYRFNVIFVHGLRGHPKRTWGRGSDETSQTPTATASGSRDRSIKSFFRRSRPSPSATPDVELQKPFWPDEFLAQDLREARVWTYGYNANVIEGLFQASNQNSVSQHGRDLAVRFEREVDNEDPVIFVVHSLGGIVVKDAIRRSEACRSRTKFIIFLGSPHRGSQYAGWAMIASNLASCALQDTNKKIVQTLKVNSEVLDNIHEEFVKIVLESGLKIHSFQEGRGLSGVKGFSGKVVDDFSSKFDLPPTIQTVESIDADHSHMTKFSDKDDSGYRAVLGVLRQFARSRPEPRTEQQVEARVEATTVTPAAEMDARTSGSAFFHVPFSINRQFVGRTEVLQELQSKLFDGEEFQRVALTGLGGIGKTQIAIHIAFWVKQYKPDYSVFWLPALSNASIDQACAEFMAGHDIQQENPTSPREPFGKYLSSPGVGKWLLIVDNADDTDLLFPPGAATQHADKWLPRNNQGRILFTTRSSKVAFQVISDPQCVVKLSEMSPDEAKDYLRKSLYRQESLQDDKTMVELLDNLDYLPLAIKQATAYMNENDLTIEEYLEVLQNTEDNMVELLRSEFRDDTRYMESEQCQNAVATTWVISFRQIRRIDPFAADLLSFMACIEPKAIPQSMLPQPETRQQLVSSIGTLCSYGFLSKYAGGQMLEMHRLVHLATRTWAKNEGTMERMAQYSAAHFDQIFPNVNWENRKLWRQYLPHALVIVREHEEDAPQNYPYRLIHAVARSLNYESRFKEALRILKRSAVIEEQQFPDNYMHRSLLATAYYNNSQHQEVIKLVEPLNQNITRTLLENNLDLLDMQLLVGFVYRAIGDLKKATRLLEHVVKRRSELVPEEDENRLQAEIELGRVYREKKQIEESIRLLESVLKVARRSFEEDHHLALKAQHELAQAYWHRGKAQEALDLLKHVVNIQQRTLGEYHLDRLALEITLAQCSLRSGEIDEATQMLETLIVKVDAALPSGHINRLLVNKGLAEAYLAKGRVPDAIHLLEGIMALSDETLGASKSAQLGAGMLLAVTYRDYGQPGKAVELLRHLTAAWKEICALGDRKLLGCKWELAWAYRGNGQTNEAVQEFEELAEAAEKFCPENTLTRSLTRRALGQAYLENGQWTKAVDSLEWAAATSVRVNNPWLADVYEELSIAYEASGRLDEAVCIDLFR